MAFDPKKPLKRAAGTIVPQVWNDEIEDWEVLQGSGGAYRMQATRLVAKEPFNASTNMTKEFSRPMSGFAIVNDSKTEELTFTIDGDTYVVSPRQSFRAEFEPFTSVQVTCSGPFKAHGLVSVGGNVVVPTTPEDTTPPNNVTNLIPSNITPTSLTLTWSASTSNDCVGYDIYRGVTIIGSVSTTVFEVTGLTQNTQYTFTIRAKDDAGNISTGTSITITTGTSADVTPPANVTNLTANNVTQTGLTLTWTASGSNDVASYDVYRGEVFLANVTGIAYTINGLSPSTDYTFFVKAKDTSGNVASGTSINVTTASPPIDTTPPVNVTGLTTSNLTDVSVTLNWTASISSDVAGYEIYNGNSLITTVTGVTYNVTGLKPSMTYTFTVKAKDASGNVASGTSATFTTKDASDTTAPIVTVKPISGAYSTAQTVSFDTNETARVFYTLDGSTPTIDASGNPVPPTLEYTSPFQVTAASTTVRYFGKDLAGNPSAVESAVYTISAGVTYVTTGLVKKWDNVVNALSMNNDGSYYPPSGEFTVCVTLKPKAYLNLLSQFNVGSQATSTMRFNLDSTGQKVSVSSWGTVSGAGSFPGKTDAAAILTDAAQYYHVAFVRDNTNSRYSVYVNNILYYNVTLPSGFTLNNNVTPPAEPLSIGAASCDIPHILYYNRVLTESELTQNYNALK